MTKRRTPTLTERMANAIRSFFIPPKPMFIRLRKRKAGEYWQVVRGREVIAQYPATRHNLDDVQDRYPAAKYKPAKAKVE